MRNDRVFRLRGFTLVELLVVIGIIALLISILLPSLNAARRNAAAVKCAAQLRQLGAAFALYKEDNHGYFPPAKMGTPPNYAIGDVTYTTTGAFWFDFLAKYVTKVKSGSAAATATEAASQRNSILWGCPAWDGYNSSASSNPGGFSAVQIGFGMNAQPKYTPTYDPVLNTDGENSFGSGINTSTGRWTKEIVYVRQYSSERMLLADSRFWLAESQKASAGPNYPPSIALQGQADYSNSVTYASGAQDQTLVDLYRHGTRPPLSAANRMSPYGGKVSYNILYCDGHVSTSSDGREAYRSYRMKFP
jgi:prepilin-type N-terminal cleavage/methylation domain-containing protein/prepilin-type processing-associated H-X9-DG protein